MFLWNCQIVVLKRENVSLDRLADIHDGLLPALTLRNTARKAWTLRHPKTVFTWIHNYLSHVANLLPRFARVKRARWPDN